MSDTGMELEEDDIYTPGFILLQVGIKSKKQCCRLLNQYMHEVRETIERQYVIRS